MLVGGFQVEEKWEEMEAQKQKEIKSPKQYL